MINYVFAVYTKNDGIKYTIGTNKKRIEEIRNAEIRRGKEVGQISMQKNPLVILSSEELRMA